MNGNPDVKFVDQKKNAELREPQIPAWDKFGDFPSGTKNKLTELGPDGFSKWLKEDRMFIMPIPPLEMLISLI